MDGMGRVNILSTFNVDTFQHFLELRAGSRNVKP